MATVDKNFRIKNGLVVEGSSATVNGNDILTKSASDQSYIINLIGGTATSTNTANAVVKRDGNGDFSAGTITADLVGNVTGQVSDISNHNTDSLGEGNANLYFTDSRARSSVSGGTGISYNSGTGVISVDNTIATQSYADGAADDAETAANSYTDTALQSYTPTASLDATVDGYGYLKSGDLTGYATETYADNAASSAISNATTDDIDEGQGNLYFTNQRALDATSAAYDAAGAASAAEAAANTYTDNQINALTTDDIEEGTTNKYYTDSRVQFKLGNSVGSGLSFNNTTGVISVDTNDIATVNYVDTAINNLVDGAPGLLDTLNEIAAAINDDANYFTTVTNAINAKQNSLTAGSNIDITNDVISVTGLNTDDVSEGSNLYFTDARARSAVDGTDRSFTSVEINEVAKQVAATTGNITPAAATTAYSWAKADFRSAKLLVKIKNGSNTEVSELLVTLDTSDNVYLTEYGMSSTSGTSLGTITADVSGSDVRVRVTPANDNSEVMVYGTLLI